MMTTLSFNRCIAVKFGVILHEVKVWLAAFQTLIKIIVMNDLAACLDGSWDVNHSSAEGCLFHFGIIASRNRPLLVFIRVLRGAAAGAMEGGGAG